MLFILMAMPNVNPPRVRLRLGLTAEDIADSDVQTFIDEASAFLSAEIGRTLNPADCTEEEANAIANLAAIYCYLKVTGVSAVGWTANLGALTFSGAPEKVAQLEFLKSQVMDFVKRHKRFGVKLLEGP
jgi:hypothetical protein